MLFDMFNNKNTDNIFLIRIDFNAVDELGNNALHVAVIFYQIILGAAQIPSLVLR